MLNLKRDRGKLSFSVFLLEAFFVDLFWISFDQVLIQIGREIRIKKIFDWLFRIISQNKNNVKIASWIKNKT